MNYTEQKDTTDDFCWKLFCEYRVVLKQFVLYHIVDESRLPIEKQSLKSVIKLLMFNQWGEDEMNGLRNAYTWLSKFQPGAETTEKIQQMNMQFYEESLERDGVKLDKMERLAHLSLSAKGALEAEELEVVENEKRMLKTELAHWERTSSS
jgi:hypothetical protein